MAAIDAFRCENSQTDPCPRVDTDVYTVSIDGSVLYTIRLCPEHVNPEWTTDTAAPVAGASDE